MLSSLGVTLAARLMGIADEKKSDVQRIGVPRHARRRFVPV